MRGRWTTLSAMLAEDVPVLSRIQEDTGVGSPWRAGPGSVPPAESEVALWRNVDLLLVIRALQGGQPLGFCVCHGLDLRSRYASISVVFDPESASRLRRLEGLGLFLEEVFGRYQLRRLLVNATDETLRQFPSITRFGFSHDVTMPNLGYSRVHGRCAFHTFSISATDWYNSRVRALLADRQTAHRVTVSA